MQVNKGSLWVILGAGVLLFAALGLGAFLGWVGHRGSLPPEHFVRVYTADDPPPARADLVWYYNPSLVPAWRHAIYLGGQWFEYRGGALEESERLPPHEGWMPDPFSAE